MSQVGSERGTRRRGTRTATALFCVLALSAAQCTFPNYDFVDGSAGSSGAGNMAGTSPLAGNGGTAGTGATAGSGAQAGTSVVMGGMAGEGGGGEAGGPACPFDSWPVEQCAGGCLQRYADHCYDGMQSGDEIASDCGGSCQPCTNEACTQDSDCLNGRCEPTGMTCSTPLTMQVEHHEMGFSVANLTFTMYLKDIEADGAQGIPLKDIEVRYYIERSGIAEPIAVRATQSNLMQVGGANMELKQTSWQLVHTQEQAGAQYDAYLSVRFDDPTKLYPGDQVRLYQQVVAGDAAHSPFDQRSNYSFSQLNESFSLHTTVFSQGKLIWGLEPGPVAPRACFAKAFNFNGGGVNIDGNTWESGNSVTTTGTLTGAGSPFPQVSGGLMTVLGTAIQVQAGQDVTVPVANGSYLAFLYVTSPGADADASELTIQGVQPASFQFRSQVVDGGQAWAKMGPYPVTVSDGSLKVGVSKGMMAFAGIELEYPE